MVRRPTKKQAELLEYLKGFIIATGYGPSYREIQRALGYKSVSTVAMHIEGLIKIGKLRKKDQTARSLELVEQSKTLTPTQQKLLLKRAERLGFEKTKDALDSYIEIEENN